MRTPRGPRGGHVEGWSSSRVGSAKMSNKFRVRSILQSRMYDNYGFAVRPQCGSVIRVVLSVVQSRRYSTFGTFQHKNRRKHTLTPGCCVLAAAAVASRCLPLVLKQQKFCLKPRYELQRIPLLGAARRHASRSTARLPLPGLAQHSAAARRNAIRSWLRGGGT